MSMCIHEQRGYMRLFFLHWIYMNSIPQILRKTNSKMQIVCLAIIQMILCLLIFISFSFQYFEKRIDEESENDRGRSRTRSERKIRFKFNKTFRKLLLIRIFFFFYRVARIEENGCDRSLQIERSNTSCESSGESPFVRLQYLTKNSSRF